MTALTEAVRRMRRLQQLDMSKYHYTEAYKALVVVEAEVDLLLAEPAAPPDPVHIDPAPVYALLRRSLAQMGKWQRKYGEHNPQWLPPDGDVKLAEDIDNMLNQVPATPQAEPSDEVLTWAPNGYQNYVCHDADGRVLGEIRQESLHLRWNANLRDGGRWIGEYLTEAQARSALILALCPAPVAEPAASGAMNFDQWADQPDPDYPKSKRRECVSARVLADFKIGWDAALAASAPPQPVAQEPDSVLNVRLLTGEARHEDVISDLQRQVAMWKQAFEQEREKFAAETLRASARAARSNLQVGVDVPGASK